MGSPTTSRPLISLKSEELDLADLNEDIRGHKVVDRDGQEVGKVDDVFVDPNERRARFIAVKSGDILGLGGKKFLIPVDAIQSRDDGQVRINETRDRIVGGPQVDGEEMEATAGSASGTGGVTGGQAETTGAVAGGQAETTGAGARAAGGDQDAPELVLAVYRWYSVAQPYWSRDYQRRNWA